MGDSYIEEFHYYPPLPFRIRPEWYKKLARNYKVVLNEIYKALDESLFILASIGARTAIDKLMVDRIGDAGSFENKLKQLVERGVIDKTDKEILSSVINTGSASAHRSFCPNQRHLRHIMDILETIFFKLIIEPGEKQKLAKKAKSLLAATPNRTKPMSLRVPVTQFSTDGDK